MNWSKTKAMTNNTRRKVEVDGQSIQYVYEYIYLGQLVTVLKHGHLQSRKIPN